MPVANTVYNLLIGLAYLQKSLPAMPKTGNWQADTNTLPASRESQLEI